MLAKLRRLKHLLDVVTRHREEEIDIDNPLILFGNDLANRNRDIANFHRFLSDLGQEVFRDFIDSFFDARPGLEFRRERICMSLSHYACRFKLKKGTGKKATIPTHNSIGLGH